MEEKLLAGRYIIKEQIGEGSYSIVYAGFDREKTIKVAIKELKHEGLTKEEFDEAHSLFFREINTLKELDHPSIPKVYDFIVVDDKNYMIMEWVEGKLLLDIIKEKGQLSQDEAIIYMSRVADILKYLQGKNIIYKDLKPSNIIVLSMNRVKLIDFGISRVYSPEKKCDTHLLGTPGYAAPEAYSKIQTDMSADIYSFGATFYHAATGEEPEQFSFFFPDPRKYNESLSKDFSKLLLDCLKEKKERIQDAEKLEEKLIEVRYSLLFTPVRFTGERNLIKTPMIIPSSIVISFITLFWVLSKFHDFFYEVKQVFFSKLILASLLIFVFCFILLWSFSTKKIHKLFCSENSMILLVMACFLLFVIIVLVPNALRRKSGLDYTKCQSNCKCLGTALEKYAEEHNGKYPESLSKLTPDYFQIIPTCDSLSRDTYSETYRTNKDRTAFTFYCKGENHYYVGVPRNYPQYNSYTGLWSK